MKWFKHPKNLFEHPVVAEIRGEFGIHGYGAVCLILERIAGPWKLNPKDAVVPFLALPMKEWQQFLEFSPKKFKKFMEICGNPDFIQLKVDRKMIRAEAPILLIYHDEYSRKRKESSGQTPDSIRTNSPTDIQIEPEVKKRQNNTVQGLTAKQKQDVFRVLAKHKIQPGSPRGAYCLAYVAQNGDNPAGYLTGILSNNPEFGNEHEIASTTQRNNTGYPQPTSEIIASLPFMQHRPRPPES